MRRQLVGSLLVIGVMIGLTGALIVHIMRRVEWELNQCSRRSTPAGC